MRASFFPVKLQFVKPVNTSRGPMQCKNSYILQIMQGDSLGTGECSFIEGLSIDDLQHLPFKLAQICDEIEEIAQNFYLHRRLPEGLIKNFPALAFGLETALLDLENGGRHEIFKDSAFYQGLYDIPINGLVWMDYREAMLQQLGQKLSDGFRCIKIKVGAIDFEEECRLLESIRERFSAEQVEIRLDANGAFTKENVYERLYSLSRYGVHSIEQPVKPRQFDLMAELCRSAIIPVVLDEELIGISEPQGREFLLKKIRPQFIILKPALLGGFQACDRWIELAENCGISWWSTSALESNVGLNAIAQWVVSKNPQMVQGLGTGNLYQNNIESPLYIRNASLSYNVSGAWGHFR